MLGIGASATLAFAVDAAWANELQTIVFYEGDAYGTVCHDVYIDATNVFQTTNFNGMGLYMHWTSAQEPERPGFIRFENWQDNIPAGSFVYRADLLLSSISNCTADGWLLIGARGNNTFDETTASYATGGGNVAVANRTSVAPDTSGFNKSVLWSRMFGTNLLADQVVTCNVSPAVRAWADYSENTSWGYPNQGLSLNNNNQGGNFNGGRVVFADSENADTNKRPKLVVQYLPPTAHYKIVLYHTTPAAYTNTSHVMKITAEDAYIRGCNWNQQWWWHQTNNYGGDPGPQLVWNMDGYLTNTVKDGDGTLFLRWKGLSYPRKIVQQIADARLRVVPSNFWNPGDSSATMAVRRPFKNWVEGGGTILGAPPYSTSQTNLTWSNYNAVAGSPALNQWEHGGGTGATDSTNLYVFTMANRDGESLSSDSNGLLAAAAQDWLDGVGTNNGLALVNTAGAITLQIANFSTSGNYQHDPYQTAGLLVVFRKLFGSVFVVH